MKIDIPFFVTIELFFRDVNKARSFVLAKKEKAKQKAEYLKEIEAKEKETEPNTDPKRTISKEVTEGFVKPLRKVVRNISGNKREGDAHPSENPTSPSRKLSSHSKTPVNTPPSSGKKRPVLVRKKKAKTEPKLYKKWIRLYLLKKKRNLIIFRLIVLRTCKLMHPRIGVSKGRFSVKCGKTNGVVGGEFQKLIEQLKNTESRMEKT